MGSTTIEKRLKALGSPGRIIVDNTNVSGDQLLTSAEAEIARIDEKFSAFNAGSIVSRINQDAGNGAFIELDRESRSLFEYASVLWEQSKRLFDPSTRLLEDCYSRDGLLLASQQQLAKLLKLVGWSGLELTEDGARLTRKGMLLDLNTCVRPYAVDCIKRKLARQGARFALIEIGQDFATIGKQVDGSNWLIGSRFPKNGRAAVTRLKLNNSSFATRGNFEKSVAIDGELFGRALSPIDGQFIPGLLSVGVMAEDCLTACSAASVARFKTEAAGLRWLEKLGMPWLAIDRQLICHGPLAPRIR
tara:strand:- start:133004 stop:133915 length:912 start_codon:yes stop_codon:yes gene_type:complete